jgi:hypothetical protein
LAAVVSEPSLLLASIQAKPPHATLRKERLKEIAIITVLVDIQDER